MLQNEKIVKNKRAVSEIIGYILLIVIALSISAGVYAWIKFQIPKPQPECPEKVSVVIKEYNCDQTLRKINITFQNKGLFDVDGVYVKIANETGKLPVWSLNPLNRQLSQKGFIYFFEANKKLETGASANSTESIIFDYGEYGSIKRISLLPFIADERIIPCAKSEVKEDVSGCD